LAIGAGIGLGVYALDKFTDYTSDALDNLMFSKGGRQNIRDTGLIGVSDSEIETRLKDPRTSPDERKRLVKEQKTRGNRNKGKDSRKNCP
jgi:hypothetical protein